MQEIDLQRADLDSLVIFGPKFLCWLGTMERTRVYRLSIKIIFDRYYCINSAKTKEITVNSILQPHHVFIVVKFLVVMLVQGGLIISLLLARLHEVHRAIVVTSVVSVYVRLRTFTSASHFRLKFLKLLYLDSH